MKTFIINESQFHRLFLTEQWGGPNFDTEHTNTVNWSADFDEDDLNDELEGCETEEEKQDAINDYYDYLDIDLECWDIDNNELGRYSGTISDIENYFDEDIANKIMTDIRQNQEYSGQISDILYKGENDVDYNNPDSVFAYAKKMYPNEHGAADYLLPDGSTIGLADHKYVNGLGGPDEMTKAKFINYGAIRLGSGREGNLDIIKEPTNAQYSAIKDYVRYSVAHNPKFELHLCSYNNGDREPHVISNVMYYEPSPDRIKYDIIHYFRDGIKPTGGYGDEY